MSKFSLKKLFQSFSLRSKVNVIFFVLLVIPLVLFSFYSAGRIRNVMREQTFTAARKTFDETCSCLDSLMSKITSVSDIIANDSNLPHLISVEEEDRNVFFALRTYLDYFSSVSKLKKMSGISDIRLYSDSKYFSRSLEGVRQTDWYASLSTFPSKQWYAPSDFSNDAGEDPRFSFMRLLHSYGNFLTYDGVLQVNVPTEEFQAALLKTTVTPNSAMLLLTEKEILLSSNDAFSADAAGLSSIVAVPEGVWQLCRLGKVRCYVTREALGTTDWALAAVIPASDVAAVSRRLSLEMIGMMLVLAGIAYYIATRLANSILKRINLLTNATWQLESGDTDIDLFSDEQDELGSLMLRFDQMAACIDRLMDEKVQYGQRIKNLELQALQAQINPHFLYNTLDTINCLAIQRNAPEITELVSSLASFYRLSLSNGSEQIPIRNEIRHAQMYLNILNSRFPDQIRVQWDISPEIEALQIIKIVLQPIIENAAIHGIYERENGTGTLMIRGWLEQEDVYITVTDDGVGMTQEVIDANFAASLPLGSGDPGGYGIRNICERLRVAYGEAYGLSCISSPGKGTSVTFHIPKIT